jgi:glycosyltransferase involved in cell wall biosynthesis
MDLSIIIPVYNYLDYTKDIIQNIRDTVEWLSYEIIVINDGSTDDTYNWLDWEDWVVVINNKKNRWVTYAWNKGAQIAKGDYVCWINNDIVIEDDLFGKLIDWFDDNILITTPRWTHWLKDEPKSKVMYYLDHFCWFCFMMKREDINILFPIPKIFKVFGNDNWMWFRTKELWYNVKIVKDAIIHHYQSITSIHVPNTDRPIFLEMAEKRGWVVVPVMTPSNKLTEDLVI